MLPGRLPEKHRELPSDDQIDRIIKGLEAEFGLFAYLILYTGLRRGEALALTHGDIDRERGLVHVKMCIRDSRYTSWANLEFHYASLLYDISLASLTLLMRLCLSKSNLFLMVR